MQHTLSLPYGTDRIELDLDSDRFDVTAVLPEDPPELPDPHDTFLQLADRPTGTRPLREIAGAKGGRGARVTIVIADHTRPVPDHLLVPWIVEALGVALDPSGNLEVGPDFMTSEPGVFAAGDSSAGASLVVHAIQAGRMAAASIDSWLAREER